MGVDGQVLLGQYRQGHPGGFQIFAGGVPRLSVGRAVRHQQGQHAAVGKVKGRFFGGVGDGGCAMAVNLSGSAGQVVAVCDGNTIIARPTHNTAQHCICIGSCDTANVITVGNTYGMLGIISRVSCNAAGPLCGRRTALLMDSYSTSVVAIGYTSRISSSNNAADINRWGGTAVGGGTAVDKADYGAEVTAICNGGITCKPSDNAACIASVSFGSDALYSAIIDTVTYLGARICNSNNATCRRLNRVPSIYRSGAHTARNAGVLRECYNTARVFSSVRVKVACYPYASDSCPIYIPEQSGSSPVAITIYALYGMPRAVKSAGVSLVIVASDKRPFRGCGSTAGAGGVIAVLVKSAVVQNDIGCQGGTGGCVLHPAVFAVDNIVEDFQFLGVGNQNRGCGSTFARQPLGRQGDRLGDRLVKIINFRAVIPFVKGVSRFSRGGRGGQLSGRV